jgi:hypothetical protein
MITPTKKLARLLPGITGSATVTTLDVYLAASRIIDE